MMELTNDGDEIKNEQYEICTENNLLVIGYGLNGDLLTVRYVEMPFKIEEFIEMAIENKNYPIDGTMAEKY